MVVSDVHPALFVDSERTDERVVVPTHSNAVATAGSPTAEEPQPPGDNQPGDDTEADGNESGVHTRRIRVKYLGEKIMPVAGITR